MLLKRALLRALGGGWLLHGCRSFAAVSPWSAPAHSAPQMQNTGAKKDFAAHSALVPEDGGLVGPLVRVALVPRRYLGHEMRRNEPPISRLCISRATWSNGVDPLLRVECCGWLEVTGRCMMMLQARLEGGQAARMSGFYWHRAIETLS